MDDRNAKIISLRERRTQDDERRRATAKAAQAAERRRRLAEYGPASGRIGRWVGIFGSALLWTVILAALVVTVWNKLR